MLVLPTRFHLLPLDALGLYTRGWKDGLSPYDWPTGLPRSLGLVL